MTDILIPTQPTNDRETALQQAATIGRTMLTLQAQPDAPDYLKLVARVGVSEYLKNAAAQIEHDHGPMSDGRAELVLARARATLDGYYDAADALRREMVGVL